MLKRLLFTLALCVPAKTFCQLVLEQNVLDNPDNEPLPCHPVPTSNQLKWHDVEFYAFFHYNINTFTDKEWGMGDEDERFYAPTQVPDPHQWLEAAKAAGMRGGIVTAKHHDGFCLWPTKSTTHSIEYCGNDNGKNANIPLLFANAAKQLDMKYGFYVSPWDRNSHLYGTDKYVTDVFLRQCTELAMYGNDQFEMWFDGANGGTGYYGGKYSNVSIDTSNYYDIPNLNDSIHKLCSNIIMWGAGQEARWCGNEQGFAGETNWAMGHLRTMSAAHLASGVENAWLWFPSEADAMATDKGWFWHEGENVKSAEELYTMYLETVGRNANFILNIPPDNSGRLPEQTVKVMHELGQLISTRLSNDIAPKARISASDTRQGGVNRNYEASNMTDGDDDTYWAPNDGVCQAVITLDWGEQDAVVHYVVLEEFIKLGQRVKSFMIETTNDGATWTTWATSVPQTTIGHKRIIPMNGSTRHYDSGYSCKKMRITIKDSRSCPTIKAIRIY